MKKIYIIFCLLIIQVNVVAFNVKDIKLIYSKNEVYPGNTFKVKLKLISTHNVAYYSDVTKKASFNKFRIEVKNGATLKKANNEFATITVDNSIKNDTIDVTLYSNYYSIDKQTFKIPIILPAKEKYITDLKCKVLSYDINQMKLNIYAQFNSSENIKVKSKGLISYDDLNIYYNNKNCLINSKGEVLLNNQNGCDSVISFKVELKDNPSIYTTVQTPININSNRLEFNQRTLSNYIDNLNHLNEIDLFIDVISLDCKKDSLLKITFKSEDNYIYKTIYLPIKDGILILNLMGENGRDGKNGTYGTNYSKNGKDGGDGESGEDGKNVIIFYTEKSKPYLSRIIIYNQGGVGGKGGKGGYGARYYYKTSESTTAVAYAPNGRVGRNGSPGKDGSVDYILIKN